MSLLVDVQGMEVVGCGDPPAGERAPAHAAFGTCEVRLRGRYAQSECAVSVRHATFGPAHAPVVVVQGGISAHRATCHDESGAPGWWSGICGPDRALDTRRFRVVSIDWLCASDVRGPAVSTDDQADAIAAVLDALGVARAHAFAGSSYGAMVGLAFASRHADRVGHVLAISGAHRPHPLSTALRNIQREVVRLARRQGDVAAGLDLARRIAMTTYRSEREFAQRCSAEPVFDGTRFRFAEEDWLAAAGGRFARTFDADRFLSLSESIDLHAVAPRDIRVPLTLIGVASDRVVPLSDLCRLQQESAAAATLHVLDSLYGHDAFLKEPERVGALVHETLCTRAG